ncbi:TonB-dependent receptor domain-containing protein [Spirosoma utsteinense]|uniref:Outer membrane receptor protein involved in Fe transport n=1 Tax=Spirosoma utsteinense TaxID=2585773 RepID=A0ABR6VZB8_9BACT|nr:outer membrane beta-barrel family protein [Spirosoma utsteinense]MBC3789575.1 outer membrane receptor protein involved in Fe transport [Spirosoma utsteinense]
MKLFFSLAALGLWVGTAFAQSVNPGSISGSLVDSATRQPVPFATVAVRNATTLIAGTTTDSAGTFRLPSLALGPYTLTLSSVRYVSRNQSVNLTTDQPAAVVGAVPLRSESRTLGEVTVAAQKALIEEKGDKLVYNAEKDVSNVGGSAADVLRKIPSLSLDLDGNIQMRGNSNIRILINGKPSAMMARNLADALRQMPADNIKSVEVITSPGAKYDAEGAAGVINIITKKALQGFNGSVMGSLGNLNRSANTKLSVKTKKIGLSFSANGYQFRQIREAQTLRTTLFEGRPLNYLSQRSTSDNTGTGGYGEFSLDYDPDSTSRINFSANAWGGSYPNNSAVINRLTDPAGNTLQYFRNDIQLRNPYGNSQFDLGYTKTFRKPAGVTSEREFTLLTQFSRMPDNYFYTTNRYTLGEVDQLSFQQRSTNYSRNKEYTLQADYTHPFLVRTGQDTTQLKLEMGLKAIGRDIGSEYRVEQSLDGQPPLVTDPAQSNDFDYRQQIYSGYTALRIEARRKWNMNLGARFERTVIDGNFMTTGTTLANQYTNLIPSVTVSKGIKSHTLKISYTQRIQRPQLWFLNPWVNASDPRNLQTGNPYLNPELNHAVELGHSVTTKAGLSVNTALYWRMTNNAIEYVRTVDEAGVSLSRPQNIARRIAYGLNMNLSGQATKTWTLNGGMDLRYVDLNSPALNQRNNGLVGNLNISSTYKLPHNYTFQSNANVNSGWINLQGSGTPFYWYGLALKREMLDKKASLTLGVNNPFNRGVSQTFRQAAPTFESDTRSFFVSRSVRLAFEWRFGQMSAGGKESRKIRNDDAGNR